MKKNLFVISESEKERILQMHRSATVKNYLSEQAAPPADPAAATAAPAASPTTPPTDVKTPQDTVSTTGETPQTETKVLNDRDYVYKKEGEKYFFKLQPNPASEKAKAFKTQNKFVDWTEATGKGLESIKKLNWGQSEGLQTKSAETLKTNTPDAVATTTTTTPVAGGGGEKPGIVDPLGDARKVMPQIDKVDPLKVREVIAWSKTPSGQYVLNTPADQREAALDNLDRRKGDETTRNLKKEIRQALGMAADTKLGQVGSALKGGLQGLRQGFRQQTT
jgi:hypothetical protein